MNHDEVIRRFKSARYRVWEYICRHPGCTDQEIRDTLKLNKNTARPRRIELEHANLVQIVFPFKVDSLGNVAERWESTGEQYPDKWKFPKADDGSALALRSMRRAIRWAVYKGNQKLFSLGKAFEKEAMKEVKIMEKRGLKK